MKDETQRMTLIEAAQRLGVETSGWCNGDAWQSHPERRSTKDIAHDVLAKLPNTTPWTINHLGGNQWAWFRELGDTGVGTFEEAVTALATRYLQP